LIATPPLKFLAEEYENRRILHMAGLADERGGAHRFQVVGQVAEVMLEGCLRLVAIVYVTDDVRSVTNPDRDVELIR
jgi:hypothetical protein